MTLYLFLSIENPDYGQLEGTSCKRRLLVSGCVEFTKVHPLYASFFFLGAASCPWMHLTNWRRSIRFLVFPTSRDAYLAWLMVSSSSSKPAILHFSDPYSIFISLSLTIAKKGSQILRTHVIKLSPQR